MRSDRGNPLLKRLGGEVAIKCDMLGILERCADLAETEFCGAARA